MGKELAGTRIIVPELEDRDVTRCATDHGMRDKKHSVDAPHREVRETVEEPDYAPIRVIARHAEGMAQTLSQLGSMGACREIEIARSQVDKPALGIEHEHADVQLSAATKCFADLGGPSIGREPPNVRADNIDVPRRLTDRRG
jgi:hypothetical protein